MLHYISRYNGTADFLFAEIQQDFYIYLPFKFPLVSFCALSVCVRWLEKFTARRRSENLGEDSPR